MVAFLNEISKRDVLEVSGIVPKNPTSEKIHLPLATVYLDEARHALFLFRDKDLTFVAVTLCIHYEDQCEAAIARQACVELHEGMREAQRKKAAVREGSSFATESGAPSSSKRAHHQLPSCTFTEGPPEQLCNAVNLARGDLELQQWFAAFGNNTQHVSVGWVTFLMQRHELFVRGSQEEVAMSPVGNN